MSSVHGGFFSLTEITDPTQHRAYNEWHQLDHLPEQFPLDGIQHGQRWVLTPQLRASAETLDPPFDRIHYLTMYLMSEPLESTFTAFHRLGARLHGEGRWFEPRQSHFAHPMVIERRQAAHRANISAAAVPFRAHSGIHVIIESHIETTTDLVTSLIATRGVAGAWSFTTNKRFDSLAWEAGEYRATVAWLDDDIGDCAQRFRNWTRTHHHDFRSVVFSATLETITPWRWNWFDSAAPDVQSTDEVL